MAPITGFKRRRAFAPRAGKRRARAFRRTKPRGEIKFHDLDIDDAVVAANGNITEDSVLTIAEGNGECDRIGRKITVTQILWRYTVEMNNVQNSANPASNDEIRVILYLDKQTNGLTAGVLDILETDDFQSFRNLANTGRFQILHDRVWDVKFFTAPGDGSAANDWGGMSVHHIMGKKVNIKVQYDDSLATGALSTMRSNNIGVLLLSRNGVGGFSSKMRIRFSDV